MSSTTPAKKTSHGHDVFCFFPAILRKPVQSTYLHLTGTGTFQIPILPLSVAKKSVRARTAVDVVNAAILLLQLESKRFKQHQESAWNWTQQLTPHGQSLRESTFAKVDYRLYTITLLMLPIVGIAELSEQT